MKLTEEQLNKKYVIKKHLTMPDKGICFFTSNTEQGRDCYNINGDLWYENVAFADTIEGAQDLAARHSTYPTMYEIEEYYKNNRS